MLLGMWFCACSHVVTSLSLSLSLDKYLTSCNHSFVLSICICVRVWVSVLVHCLYSRLLFLQVAGLLGIVTGLRWQDNEPDRGSGVFIRG